GGLGGTQSVPSDRAARPEAVSSVAPIALAIDAPCVLASERPSRPDDERRATKPSYANSRFSTSAFVGACATKTSFSFSAASGSGGDGIAERPLLLNIA